LAVLRAERPSRPVELWAMDEHRLGLKPVLRRRWAPKGQRPVAVGHHRYAWLYLDGFVHPSTGEVTWFLCNGVSTELFEALLIAFAQATGAGAGKLILLALDNAGWHVSEKLRVPEGIELAFLPPYTPELQPAEHLWPLADEAVANQSFATLEELDQALAERCRTLATMPALIQAHTRFDWWPADTNSPALN
jgi:hypothetical protein